MPGDINLQSLIFGRLTWDALPLHEPILVVTFSVVVLGGLGLLGLITWFKLWGYLFKEWFTSVDHKKIGIMYVIFAVVMMLRGVADAVMMRTQQAIAVGSNEGFLPQHHYDQVFTAHGVIMIFFMAMPFVTGVMNFVVPLQIGARDVSFPFLNNLSFWMSVAGAIIIMISLFIGEFARTGWLAYPPLSGPDYSPGVGVDYYIWGLQVAGVGTTLSGINLIATIVKMRAPGMTLMKMPIFTWTSLCTNILIVATFPILTATLALLSLDRYVGTHFFTNDLGGNPMMYVNLIWIWGHPEVYILVLPAFGIFSEVVATFCGKRLFGYASMVYATVVITILSYLVWLHHFFTMGSGASVNAFFGITTMIISIPTGAKIFNWLFTMYRGRIRFELPMYWTVGFMVTFVIGGMTGVLLAVPPADFVLHNSLFLVAHFHNVIVGGVVFGLMAGIIYWFPKAFGFRLERFWGLISFWCALIGFWVTFTPLYAMGLMGVTRRLNRLEDPSLQFWTIMAAVGVAISAAGIAATIIQLVVSFLRREQLRDVTGDPWNGRTLEWSTSSPPPDYNYAFTPISHDRDAWYDMKRRGSQFPSEGFRPIHMPKNTATGLVIAALSVPLAFGLVWYIWWMAAGCFLAILVVTIAHTFDYNRDFFIPADVVEKTERRHLDDLPRRDPRVVAPINPSFPKGTRVNGTHMPDTSDGQAEKEAQPSGNISEDDRQAITERSSSSAKVVHEVVRLQGDEELDRPVRSLLFSGFAAGVSICASLLTEAFLQMRLPDAPWRELIVPFGYTAGFVIVILGKLQLFTETTVTAVLPFATHPTARNLGRLLRLWVIVFLANIAGALFVAVLIAKQIVVGPEQLSAALDVSKDLLERDFARTLLLAMPAGFLIASIAWILPNAQGSEFWVIVLITYVIALGEFSHVVAGSAEAWLLMLAGKISVSGAIGDFILPALIGNVIGGTGLFAVVAHGQVRGEIKPDN